jgi:hypothetical protein
MARPRIFVSSTYYDLRHIRSSLELFIESLGYDSILSEKGDIAYLHDTPLDESCYREAASSDMLILIIGGRYGSEKSGGENKNRDDFFSRYESITKKEYESASNRDIPIYTLIDENVYSEYQTFNRNRELKINYAHVDSINIFLFIDQIVGMKRNNPIKTFGRFSDIESWLKEQWAGLFRELLNKKSQQKNLKEITAQISDLREINETLRKYIENIMTNKSTDESENLIKTEGERLMMIRRLEDIANNRFAEYLMDRCEITAEGIENILLKTNNEKEFVEMLRGKCVNHMYILSLIKENQMARDDINRLYEIVGKKGILEELDRKEEIKKKRRVREIIVKENKEKDDE